MSTKIFNEKIEETVWRDFKEDPNQTMKSIADKYQITIKKTCAIVSEKLKKKN